MSNKMDKGFFKLTNIMPIAFKMPNYPVKICLLCRGPLIEPCNNCTERGTDKCAVMEDNGSYYHTHCYNFLNPKDSKKK